MESHDLQSQTTRPALNAGGWTLPAAILAGSLFVGFLQPMTLLIGIPALIWLAMIHRANLRAIHLHQHDRLELDHQLNEAHALRLKLESILDSADVPIITTNHAGSIIQANTAANTLLGSGRPLVGEFFDALIPHQPVRELEHLARSGEPGHARLQLPVSSDMRIFDVSASPIATTQGAVCTFTDITEPSRSATLKADFAANASHELRTPIAAILGAVQTIEGPAADDPAMTQKLIAMISTHASRLDLMVKDLLDLSKLESTDIPLVIAEVHLAEIIQRASAPFSSLCERRGLTIETQIHPNSLGIFTDDSLLELILRNLIGNAAKFAHQHTSITIQIEPASITIDPESPPPKQLDYTTGVRIGIRDKGIGIPLSQQTRIFERFYQVNDARDGSSARRGTGLGLAIVKHAAKTLGGTIRLNSIHQQGTTMIVELPCCIAEAT